MNKMQMSVIKYTNDTKSLNFSIIRGYPSVYINPVNTEGKTTKHIFKAPLYTNFLFRLEKAIQSLLAREVISKEWMVVQSRIPVPEGIDQKTVPNRVYTVKVGIDEEQHSYLTFEYVGLDNVSYVDKFILDTTTEVKTIGQEDEWKESKGYDGLINLYTFITKQLPLSIALTRDVTEVIYQDNSPKISTSKSSGEDDIPY